MSEKMIIPGDMEMPKENLSEHEAPLAERLQNIVSVFPLPDYITELEPQFDLGKPRLRILFAQDIINLEWQKSEFYKQLKVELGKNNLEMSSLVSAGGQSESYLIYELRVDGKTNWRRWVNHPESISQTAQNVLDRVAEEISQQGGSDSFEKYSNYYEEAFKRGLISEEEKQLVSSEKYKASWGG